MQQMIRFEKIEQNRDISNFVILREISLMETQIGHKGV
jgi:hypothetical protein